MVKAVVKVIILNLKVKAIILNLRRCFRALYLKHLTNLKVEIRCIRSHVFVGTKRKHLSLYAKNVLSLLCRSRTEL